VSGTTIPTTPSVFGAKYQHHLRVACDLVRLYETIECPLTASNIQWNPVMRWFKELWDTIKDYHKGDDPDAPRISEALPIIG